MRFAAAVVLALALADCGIRSQTASLPPSATYVKSSTAQPQSLYVESYNSNTIQVYAIGTTSVKYQIAGPAGCLFWGPLTFTATGWLVASCGTAIIEVPPGATKAKRIIANVVPESVAAMSVDASDNLYVVGESYTSARGSIMEFSPWNSVPIRTIAIEASAFALLTDGGGNILLAHGARAPAAQGIAIYPAGTSVTETRNVPFRVPPTSMARDAKGTIYVGGYTGAWPTLSAEIVEYAPDMKTKLRTIVGPPKLGLGDLRVDATGRVYALYFGRPLYRLHHPGTPVYDIDVYEPGTTTPSRAIHESLQNPRTIAVDHRGYIYALNIGPREKHPIRYVNPSIAVYAPGSSSPVRTITDGLSGPTTMAVGP